MFLQYSLKMRAHTHTHACTRSCTETRELSQYYLPGLILFIAFCFCAISIIVLYLILFAICAHEWWRIRNSRTDYRQIPLTTVSFAFFHQPQSPRRRTYSTCWFLIIYFLHSRFVCFCDVTWLKEMRPICNLIEMWISKKRVHVHAH